MWSKFINQFKPGPPLPVEPLRLGGRQVPLLLVRHARARRYLLRLRPDGSARVTIPRGGTLIEARKFAERNQTWLEQQWERLQARPHQSTRWQAGSEIWFRGELIRIELIAPDQVRLGGETLPVADLVADLRPAIEKHLRKIATLELPPRVKEFAALHNLSVQRITVRNQQSRWGSCSRRRTISLNWRLVQTPTFVRDYIIWHELAHLQHMNHSDRFWQEVARLCPDYRTAEHWLKQHRGFFH